MPTDDMHHPLFAELSEFGMRAIRVIEPFPFYDYYPGPHHRLFYMAVLYDLREKTGGDPSLVTADMIHASASDTKNHPTHGYRNLRNWVTGEPYLDLGDEDRSARGRIL